MTISREWNSVNNECEPHAPTRIMTLKGGWFGLTPPDQLILPMYADSEAIRLATVITPPRRCRSKYYDSRILTFMDIEVEECNVRICNNEENNK